jgi:probable F420-dependent oxidoreductase
MRFGLALPQYGDFADGASVAEVARQAERLGAASLWASDRLLVATDPRNRYPRFGGESDVPAPYRVFLDPLAVLAAAAAVTSAPRLGTDVLVAPWYPPALLARTLATVDRISAGRLDIGLGTGWSADEYEAVGVPLAERGARLDEALDVLDHLWTGEPAAHRGAHWTIPESHPGVRPVGRPPVLLSAFTGRALRRVVERADGWLPADLPTWLLGHLWTGLREQAEAAGRDPGTLRFVVRICPTGDAGSPVGGSVGEVADYLLAAAELGAHECVADLQQVCRTPAELIEFAGHLIDKLA